MRVLFVGHGPAHIPWIVPLAWAARLAGHEVRVAVRPQCVPPVIRAGLIAVPVGDEATAGAAAARRLTLGPDRPGRAGPDRAGPGAARTPPADLTAPPLAPSKPAQGPAPTEIVVRPPPPVAA